VIRLSRSSSRFPSRILLKLVKSKSGAVICHPVFVDSCKSWILSLSVTGTLPGIFCPAPFPCPFLPSGVHKALIGGPSSPFPVFCLGSAHPDIAQQGLSAHAQYAQQISGVNALSACPGGTEGIYPEVLGIDLQINVLCLRKHRYSCCGCVYSAGGFCCRHSLYPCAHRFHILICCRHPCPGWTQLLP